eukprot:4386157-Karenia_brevis.AAC.1
MCVLHGKSDHPTNMSIEPAMPLLKAVQHATFQAWATPMPPNTPLYCLCFVLYGLYKGRRRGGRFECACECGSSAFEFG